MDHPMRQNGSQPLATTDLSLDLGGGEVQRSLLHHPRLTTLRTLDFGMIEGQPGNGDSVRRLPSGDANR